MTATPVTQLGLNGAGKSRKVDFQKPVKQPFEQRFTSPGTWTWPGNCDSVEVLLVGGGGGGNGFTPPATIGPSGGGGGVRVASVDVSGPVPVTVGAGGTAGPNTAPQAGGTGGTSAFGPIPSPTSAIVGGGFAGVPNPQNLLPQANWNIGGSGVLYSGRYGNAGLSRPDANVGFSGGAGGSFFHVNLNYAGADKYGFGAGNAPTENNGCTFGGGGLGAVATANTGKGGTGAASGGTARAGASGIVIVRWYE